MLSLLFILQAALAILSMFVYEIRPMHGALFAAVMLGFMRFGASHGVAKNSVAKGVVALVWFDVLAGLVWMAASSTSPSELMWLRVANATLVTTWWFLSARKLSDA